MNVLIGGSIDIQRPSALGANRVEMVCALQTLFKHSCISNTINRAHNVMYLAVLLSLLRISSAFVARDFPRKH